MNDIDIERIIIYILNVIQYTFGKFAKFIFYSVLIMDKPPL